jgi:BarA-like signal transduction histidine kinase
METKAEELALHLERVKKALSTLEEVLAMPYTAIVRDASIQRFEYTLRLHGSCLKRLPR